ncbi:MAG: hypothetical protein ABGZ53_02325 [Fuerstiella sp.]
MTLSIKRGLTKYSASSSHRDLPRHPELHWRGLLFPDHGDVYGKFQPTEQLLPPVDPNSQRGEYNRGYAILCHCKPFCDRSQPFGSENRYPDIPDRWDLYLLLQHQYDAIAFTGKTVGAIIRRTERSSPKIEELQQWETNPKGGRYRRTRVRSQLKNRLGRSPYPWEVERAHAKSALRYLKLKWTDKPNRRHQEWPHCLHKLGLETEISRDIKPARRTFYK